MKRITTMLVVTTLLAGCGGDLSTQGDATSDTATDSAVDTTADTPVDTTPDGPPPDCTAMNAMAEGACAAIVPGVKWNGSGCVALGSGCSCVGDDCDSVYDTVGECVTDRLGCYDQSCYAAEVSDDMCVDCFVEMYLGTFWTGMGCFDLWGCECYGDGCDQAFTSIEECEMVQARCDAALCEATDGTWFTGYSCATCGHFDCGNPPPEACCSAGCNCGAGRNFVPGSGCVDSPDCSAASRCEATHGTWHPLDECRCEFHCGEEVLCSDCMEACDCGPWRNFDDTLGCVFDAADCGDIDREGLCEATGGVWHVDDGGCGDFTCGRPNLVEPCVAPGCDCGPNMNFDSVEGCIANLTCQMPDVGEECSGFGFDSTCRPGLACCNLCGMMGSGCITCEIPCCEDSSICEDGCLPPPP